MNFVYHVRGELDKSVEKQTVLQVLRPFHILHFLITKSQAYLSVVR